MKSILILPGFNLVIIACKILVCECCVADDWSYPGSTLWELTSDLVTCGALFCLLLLQGVPQIHTLIFILAISLFKIFEEMGHFFEQTLYELGRKEYNDHYKVYSQQIANHIFVNTLYFDWFEFTVCWVHENQVSSWS